MFAALIESDERTREERREVRGRGGGLLKARATKVLRRRAREQCPRSSRSARTRDSPAQPAYLSVLVCPTLAMTPAAAIALLLLLGSASAQVRYFGKELGALSALQHGVRGRVFAVDSRTLYLQDFHYDGEGPAAYFYVGKSGSPSGSAAGATRLRDERGGAGPLRRYTGEGLTLSLPDGNTLKDYRWFSVYCDEYSVNFGDVSIPRDAEFPRPARVAALRGVHGVSSDPVVVVDAQTLLVPNFSYDGEAPDAKFWVGRGDKPSPQGIRIPDENGKEAPLRKYDKKTIVLTLPGELTVFDIGHFGVWCEAFTVNFGHVALPRAALGNVPPSLKMLGVSPQSRNSALAGSSTARPARPRRPLARLDATTYRPPRPLRAGTAVLHAGDAAARLPLHRRADSFSAPEQQLVSIQSSKEFTIKADGSLEQAEKQQPEPNQQQEGFIQQQQLGGLQHSHQLQQHQHEYQQLLLQQQLLQQRQKQIEQQQKLLNEQIYYNQQQPEPQNYQQQNYYSQPQTEQPAQQLQYEQQAQQPQREQQLQYEQQAQQPQREQQLQYEQQAQQPQSEQQLQYEQQSRAFSPTAPGREEEPFQYRLLPYAGRT
ncbi:hypothetical protein PYW08_009912 [Mythimna loreyi]|uniref:Uncharacterized protein n=1 Tax=Mythimna loreyi TaxID=667449 RepID=A0ACC2Q8F8_9NEOP|nr:hypothetical protein PYW08_009912 [Mythimna loreyi]